jgi:hypothetical protein
MGWGIVRRETNQGGWGEGEGALTSGPWATPSLTKAWCALKVTVCVPVKVRSWSSPESHVAGSQGSWATEGAEAA